MGEVTITAEEYRELVLKAYRYDRLREECLKASYASTIEEILFDITNEELTAMRERRNS